MLSFDPRKWLVENTSEQNGQSVATVATVAGTVPELKKLHPRSGWRNSEKSALGTLPATIATPATFSGWAQQLALPNANQPPDGFCITLWSIIYADATWLMDNFGELAARDSWSDADLFGLWPGKPHWGGIADRLRGARSLVMDADRASWRTWGQIERFNRGAYPHLRPFWESAALLITRA